MKKFTFSLFILLMLSASASAQKRTYAPNIDVHIMPIALAFPDPSLRIGTEYMTSGRWSYGISLGGGLNVLGLHRAPWNSLKSRKYNMVEIRPEVKFYWLRRENVGWYAAAEGVFLRVHRTLGKNDHYLSDSTKLSFDGSKFSKSKAGFVVKLGTKFIVPERLTIDLYTGFGLAKANVRYSRIENPREVSYDPFFEGENFFPGRKWTPLVSFGAKFGLLVWQKQE
ncbi:DUF3575 domain-containing protein [Dyadobacter fermentans]|uniref:Outer membrane protein beta-barrel domain-containing protein n=1 Tax=Dyadobacter fermentans (strain ATCC 700827 / DSM 18053 / CIP 107007 / KCTC 52180 / NS114) TaxID=471854 RepID=C6VUV2_DYAFD|nr:DUF3575 domain-containing protein [Dyadobacter fermentans]ACT93089.1 hypothetical protein Dfer_1852 [Dyadobacter fermentans DSM 18053]